MSPGIRRLAGSEKKGWTAKRNRHLPWAAGQPAPVAGGVHGGRSDAGWRAVDEFVAAGVVAAVGETGDTRQPADDSPAAAATEVGTAHGTEEENHGAPP